MSCPPVPFTRADAQRAASVLGTKLARLRRKHAKLTTWVDKLSAAISALETDIIGLDRMVPEQPTQESFDFLVNNVLEPVEDDKFGYLRDDDIPF